ncbi:acyl-CoA dehydrogenase family protein [Modestobacter sp. VKM Ac-2986]|uniref:acyl-CoA dehydrogenase family protein n=1 Tax=Modestobacter sp. VKM Ac-2986 TaxID=3004140 RepID=UPI0022AAF1A9|nr:acyl-CoA dehydrogenase family protein [Modestobacter sp. VKM Ac-2986]MCZ2828748.1 acyl-CoA dehydrogenase family protein [Modestobacter sp. VKM Ac-2986]
MTADHLPADFFAFQSLLSDSEQKELVALREFLAAEVKPRVNAAWAAAEFPMDLIPRFVEADLVGRSYDHEGRPRISRLMEGFQAMELARVDPSMATFFGVHNGLALGSLMLLGSAEQQARWVPSMRTMETIGAFGLTEPLGGSDVARGMRTTARRDGDEWVLDGAKRWIGNGTFADVLIVFARDVADDQVKGFLVEKGTPGFSAAKIEHKFALRTVQNADLTFTDCRIPASAKLENCNSFRDVNKVLKETRAGVAWAGVGCQLGAYEVAVRYAKEREQFGRPIGGFQLIQDLLARMLGNVTASMGMTVRLSQLQEDGLLRDDQAALAKSYVTSRCRETVAWARELFGGNGIVLEHDVIRFFADAEALYSYEGTREMNTLIVGRSITGLSAFA